MFKKPLSPYEEKMLVLILRTVGTMSFLALFFVFVPYGWMNRLHALAGLGILPAEPVVGYLARSTSAFYAFLGVVKWLASMDIRRYRALTLTIAGFMFTFGAVFLFVDYREGLGLIWAVGEGGINLFFGVLLFWLGWRVPKVKA